MAYRDLAKGAIAGLKERAGSSLPAIKKFLKLDASKNRFLNAALSSGVKSGFFVKNKGKYKLGAAAKGFQTGQQIGDAAIAAAPIVGGAAGSQSWAVRPGRSRTAPETRRPAGTPNRRLV